MRWIEKLEKYFKDNRVPFEVERLKRSEYILIKKRVDHQ